MRKITLYLDTDSAVENAYTSSVMLMQILPKLDELATRTLMYSHALQVCWLPLAVNSLQASTNADIVQDSNREEACLTNMRRIAMVACNFNNHLLQNIGNRVQRSSISSFYYHGYRIIQHVIKE